MFIVIEGIDGTGKSSVINELHRKINNSIVTRTPGGDPEVGPLIRKILLSKNGLVKESQALLFIADMLQVDKNIIQPALKNNLTVLCDRFYLSTYIYQFTNKKLPMAVKNLKHGNLFTKPDYTFILDIPVEIALSRMGKEKDRYESDTVDTWNMRRTKYLAQANAENTHLINTKDKSIKEVTDIIMQTLAQES